MRARIRLATLPLALAAWLTTVAPAWANSVDPELYPEAAEEYERMMTTTFGVVFGCCGLAIVLAIAFVAGLIIWLVRRDKRKQAEALAAANAAAPATPPAVQTEATPTPAAAPPAEESAPPDAQ